jgi:hypothetical protein
VKLDNTIGLASSTQLPQQSLELRDEWLDFMLGEVKWITLRTDRNHTDRRIIRLGVETVDRVVH